MIVDLHAHYPMHLLPDAPGDPLKVLSSGQHGDRWRDRANQTLVRFASRFANYESPSAGPGVTVKRMKEGGVSVCCSVLYSFWDEFDLTLWRRGMPPDPSYFPTLERQIDTVEQRLVQHHLGDVALVRNPAELDAALESGTLAMIHTLEGGFHVGHDARSMDAHVTQLAHRGIASIAPAHLIYRGIATNAAALPFLPDWVYHLIFRQPQHGLTALGETLVRAMVRERMLIDITHMSAASLADTFDLLDDLDPQRTLPVIGSHIACRFGGLEYSITDDTIARVAARGGVLGVLFCDHFVRDGLRRRRVEDLEGSLDLIGKHVDRIARVAGGHHVAALGSDLDGFIKPMLPGLEHMGRMRHLVAGLERRYGEAVASAIAGENALRVLRGGWRGRPAA
ncbi:dipeptidase [Paraconexibacter sp.]|uniref:dipeptidase n=1 Tax=Paraconexibacter sp. TaxID=2949640 RepID=UPI0035675369